MSPDIAASIKARLLAKAREHGEEFELLLVRFACERILYRLGESELRDKCTLKGAGLLTLWMEDPYRSTRDLDFLASGPNDEVSIRRSVEGICRISCVEDGLTFDLNNMAILPIRAVQRYPGKRATLNAYLGKARIHLQLDFGFGDAVVPAPEVSLFPTLLDGLPVPRVRTYPRVVAVAEKFEAMVHLGRRNSRMKDFHDILALSESFLFEGASLRDAVAGCFGRRSAVWTEEVPDALTPAFYADSGLQSRWEAYRRSGSFRTPPPANFEQVGTGVRGFLLPVRDIMVTGGRFDLTWPAGGPWI